MKIFVKEYDQNGKFMFDCSMPFNGKLVYYVALNVLANSTKNIWASAKKSYAIFKNKTYSNENAARILASMYLLKKYGLDHFYLITYKKNPHIYCWFNLARNSQYIFNISKSPNTTLRLNNRFIKDWLKRIKAIGGYTCFYDPIKNELNMYDPKEEDRDFELPTEEILVSFYKRLKRDLLEFEDIEKIKRGSNEFFVFKENGFTIGLDSKIIENDLSMSVLKDSFKTKLENEDTLIMNGIYINVPDDRQIER